MIDVVYIATTWLAKYSAAIEAGDADATLGTFLTHGWLRDVLIFTWDTRSIEGHDKLQAYLADTLPAAKISEIKLDEQEHLRTEPAPDQGVRFGFTFETPHGFGHGYAYVYLEEHSGEWKALTVLMQLEEIKGHEEVGPESGVYAGHTLAWEEVRDERRAKIEADPYVLILGAGQTGLNIASRFKQMRIPAILIEKNANVGDQWRQRYPTLTLHTPRNHHTLLYAPFPKNWPLYTPRDKLASWLQHYAETHDLVVWTRSTILPGATYDAETKRWDVTVLRDGKEVQLRPAHIVVAISILCNPWIPDIPDRHLFKGESYHASEYQGGAPYKGKRALVVGAGNTSADICQDLAFRGAEVTMLQRSSTCVISSKTVEGWMAIAYPDGAPHEIMDFKFAAQPLQVQRAWAKAHEQEMWDREAELHAHLRKGGLKLNMGRDGSGQYFLMFERGGGYWIDVGCAEMIGDGLVKVKHGTEVERFKESSVVFTDGTELDVDLVILATGYTDSRDLLKPIFGAEVIHQTTPMWGLDEESEVIGCYRPTGHPGMWYGAGDFTMSRANSKQLALLIRAAQLGLYNN